MVSNSFITLCVPCKSNVDLFGRGTGPMARHGLNGPKCRKLPQLCFLRVALAGLGPGLGYLAGMPSRL